MQPRWSWAASGDDGCRRCATASAPCIAFSVDAFGTFCCRQVRSEAEWRMAASSRSVCSSQCAWTLDVCPRLSRSFLRPRWASVSLRRQPGPRIFTSVGAFFFF